MFRVKMPNDDQTEPLNIGCNDTPMKNTSVGFIINRQIIPQEDTQQVWYDIART